MTPFLDVRGLKKYFPVRTGAFGSETRVVKAVDEVTFTVRRQETFALVGESGCGKSTLGRTLLRLVEPTAGTAALDGTELTARGPRGPAPHAHAHADHVPGPVCLPEPAHARGAIIGEPLTSTRWAGAGRSGSGSGSSWSWWG